MKRTIKSSGEQDLDSNHQKSLEVDFLRTFFMSCFSLQFYIQEHFAFLQQNYSVHFAEKQNQLTIFIVKRNSKQFFKCQVEKN